MRALLASFVLLLTTSLLLAGCGAASAGPMTWLDRPLDGASLPLAPVTIQAHASDDDGVVSFEFFVDDDPLVTASAEGGRLGTAMVEWDPTAPGTYTIRARGIDAQGNAGSDATSVVTVGQVLETPPEPGEGDVVFFAEPDVIPLGACTLLHWEVLPPTEALLDGEPVPPAGEREVCPEETRVYELLVPERDQARTATVHIEPAPESEIPMFLAVDPDAIPAGDCASLFWEVQAPEEWPAFIEGQEVPHTGEQQVCPESTTTYELLVETPDAPQTTAVTLRVEGAPEPPPPPTGTPLPTATQPPAPQPTPTAPPAAPRIVSFQANPGSILAGQCSTLSWAVEGVISAVYFDDEGVGDHDSRTICLALSRTFNLRAVGPGGETTASATVTVTQPQPTATQPFSADLAITDLYPETPHGPVWVRITNRGGPSTVNHTVQLSCQWNERDPIEGTSTPGQQGPMSIPISNLGPNQTQAFNTDIPIVAGYQYDMTCTIQVPFTDPNLGNNTYFEQMP